MSSSQKFCTNCGALLLDKSNRPAFELYDEELHRKSNILKLMVCSKCSQVADKYIECDGPLLLIDLALQSKEAYRHVLFNGGYGPLIVRMALLTLICDGYIEWANSAEAGEFFEQEYEFYLKCFKIVLGIVTFLCIVLIPCLFKAPNAGINKLMLGLLLSYCSRFCNLIALLWAPKNNAADSAMMDLNFFTSPQIMWGFIIVLFFISSVRVYEVTQGSKMSTSILHLLLGHACFYYVLENWDIIIQAESEIPKTLVE
eukprot:10242.XXX_463511_464345_1 [CDS] Oithona nana genome sequencing.